VILSAYPQAAPAGSLQLWAGLFDTENPPAVTFTINETAAAPDVVAAMTPIRDAMVGPTGRPINHRGVFRFGDREPGRRYRVVISAGNERLALLVGTLPAGVPPTLDGAFNVLLCSCYYQPEDASGLLGTIVTQIMVQPQLTLMLGDQIYGDLPLFEDLPADDAGVARKLGDKYRRNWTSAQRGTGGLGPVLTRAPVACVADDHEFWNNYPFRQTQLPKTWTAAGRAQWRKAALDLYADYQLAGAAGGTQRIDVDPLRILIVDMRCFRDEAFDRLMPEATLQAISDWASGLIEAKRNGTPAYGMLASGQALFVRAANDSERKSVDAEMANYAQFATRVTAEIDRLADEGIPLIYVTGDVHWGRVSQGLDVRNNRVLLHEVIASPSRLIRVPLLDTGKDVLNTGKGIFGKAEPWPRHTEPASVPKDFGSHGRFRLECDVEHGGGLAQRGDQIAIMSFSRAGQGVNFAVSYYGITEDKALAKSCTTRTYELRIN